MLENGDDDLTLGLVFPILLRRRDWRLFADRLEIEQKAILWPFGRHIRASVPFGEIKAAHRAELFGGLTVVEIETRKGSAYRLSPGNIGSGREVRRDDAGFETSFDAIADAIRATGQALPTGGTLRTLWDSIVGQGILGLIILIAGLLAGLSRYAGIAWGEPRFAFPIFIAYLFGQLAWSLLRKKLRERRGG